MKKFFLLLILIFISFSLYSQIINFENKSLSLSVSPSFGVISGHSEEIAYMYEESDTYMSELLWNMSPLFYYGIGIDAAWKLPNSINIQNIFVSGSAKWGIPGKTGKIEDRDWDPDYPDWLTHYSVHDNTTREALLLEFNFGANFVLLDKFLFKPFFSFDYMYFSWLASGGSLLYPESDGGHIYFPVDKNVMAYKQRWYMFSPGLAFSGNFNKFFGLELSFKISPFIWCNAVDEHLMKGVNYFDYMYGGIFLEPKCVFSVFFSSVFYMELSVSYRKISGPRGDDVVKANSLRYTLRNSNAAGAGFDVWDAGLLFRLNIF
jgi:outer membrane protease